MKRKQLVSLLLCAALALSATGGAAPLPAASAGTAAQGLPLLEQAGLNGPGAGLLAGQPFDGNGRTEATPNNQPAPRQTDAGDDTEALIKDPVLRSCMRRAGWDKNNDGTLTLDELAEGKTLSCDQEDISDLSGLEYAVNLGSLSLASCQNVTDLTPLAGLKNLGYLNLERTGVRDLAPLAGLTYLATLKLGWTPATDVSPLSGLTGLNTLSLNDMPITSLPDCTKMMWLRRLDARNTGVSDLTPLVGPVNLQTLDLSGTPVTDLSPLSELYLDDLSLRNCAQLTDISAFLSILRRLDTVELAGSGVPLEERARLLNLPDEIRALPEASVVVSPNGVFDSYEFVSDNPAIQTDYRPSYSHYYLYVTTAEPCAGTISVYGDGELVKQIRVDAPLTPDEYVRIPDKALGYALRVNGLVDGGTGIFLRSELSSVTELGMNGSEMGRAITDLTGLEYATSLTSLNLRNNDVTDLTPLAGLESLKELHLDGNKNLTAFGSLAGKKLDVLTVENTGLSEREKMEMFYFRDSSSIKGEYAKFQTGPEGIRYTPRAFSYAVEDPGVVSIAISSAGDFYQYQGMEAGTTQVTATWEDRTFTFSVTVEGIDPEQPVGPDEPGQTRLSMYRTRHDGQTGAAVRPNGELLALHNGEAQKLGEAIASSKAEEGCYNGQYPGRLNAFGSDGSLWTWEIHEEQSSISACFTNPAHYQQKVVRADGNYALTESGDLIDLWLGETVLTGVTDWTTIISTRADRVTWALCENGNLYASSDDETGTLPFSLYWGSGNVMQLEEMRFLQQDGGCYQMDFYFGDNSDVLFESPRFIAGQVTELYGIYYLLRSDGLWNDTGTHRLLDHPPTVWAPFYFSDGPNLYFMSFGIPVLVQQNFQAFIRGGYIDIDGIARTMQGEPLTDLDDRGTDVVDSGWRRSKEGLLKRYDVPILTHVTSFSLGCAVRSDGSVWNIAGVPFEIVAAPEQDFALSQTSLSLTETESARLTALLFGSDPGQPLVWETDRPEVAVPAEDGTILALGAGRAVITVSTQDGNYSAACEVEVSPLEVAFDQEGLTVTGLLPGRTVEDVARQTGAEILGSDGQPAAPGAPIATGMKLVKDGRSYEAVVYGDLNGDGEINLNDLLRLTDEVLGKGEQRLSGAALQAASLNRKEELSIFDVMKLSDHLLGKYVLPQKA